MFFNWWKHVKTNGYWHLFSNRKTLASYVSLPEGNPKFLVCWVIKSPWFSHVNHHFPMVFPWFSHGFYEPNSTLTKKVLVPVFILEPLLSFIHGRAIFVRRAKFYVAQKLWFHQFMVWLTKNYGLINQKHPKFHQSTKLLGFVDSFFWFDSLVGIAFPPPCLRDFHYSGKRQAYGASAMAPFQ